MVMELIHGLMALNMSETLEMVSLMDRVRILCQMKQNMSGTLEMVSIMDNVTH